MAKDSQPDDDDAFVWSPSGLTNRIAQRFGLMHPPMIRRCWRVLVLILITWLPLVVLAGFAGHISGREVGISLWRDPEVNGRFLLALPLLDLAEVFLIFSLAAQVRQFLRSGIISAQEASRFEAARTQAQRWHDASLSEVILFVIAFAGALFTRMSNLPGTVSSWEHFNGRITPAGWWQMLVSLPLLYFFLLRAVWVLLLWAWFLFRASRLELSLTPTHPDRAGGLGFLGWGLASFVPTAFSVSIIVSAGFAYEIYHRGESLSTLKYHLIIYVILVTLVLHLPVLPFFMQLSRCRYRGLLEFGRLVGRHDRAFDDKWLRQPSPKSQDPLLGSPDVQSLAAIATAYEHIQSMRMLPWDRAAVALIVVSAIVPLLPLIGTEIPFPDILSKLMGLLI